MQYNNIFSFENFKKLNENKFEKFDKIYEDLDFSNKTKFSESLVGRLMNGLFSYASRMTITALLSSYYQSKLENIYYNAIKKFVEENNIDLESIRMSSEEIIEEVETEVQKDEKEYENIKDKYSNLGADDLNKKNDVQELLKTFNDDIQLIIYYYNDRKNELTAEQKSKILQLLSKLENMRNNLSISPDDVYGDVMDTMNNLFNIDLKSGSSEEEKMDKIKNYVNNLYEFSLNVNVDKILDVNTFFSLVDLVNVVNKFLNKLTDLFKNQLVYTNKKNFYSALLKQLKETNNNLLSELDSKIKISNAKTEEEKENIRQFLNLPITIDGKKYRLLDILNDKKNLDKNFQYKINEIRSKMGKKSQNIDNIDKLLKIENELKSELLNQEKEKVYNESVLNEDKFSRKTGIDKEDLNTFLKKLSDVDLDKLLEQIKKSNEYKKIISNYVDKDKLVGLQTAINGLIGIDIEGVKDERHNFILGERQRKKLETTWKKIVSKVKSKFNPFIDMDLVDPYVVYNREEGLRKNYNNSNYFNSVKNVVDNLKNLTLESKALNSVGAKNADIKAGIKDNSFGLITAVDPGLKEIDVDYGDVAISVYYKMIKIEDDFWHTYQILDFFDMEYIINNYENANNDDERSKLILESKYDPSNPSNHKKCDLVKKQLIDNLNYKNENIYFIRHRSIKKTEFLENKSSKIHNSWGYVSKIENGEIKFLFGEKFYNYGDFEEKISNGLKLLNYDIFSEKNEYANKQKVDTFKRKYNFPLKNILSYSIVSFKDEWGAVNNRIDDTYYDIFTKLDINTDIFKKIRIHVY